MSDPRTTGGDEKSQTPAEIQDHIVSTREDLAETVQALGAKLDVKTRVTNSAGATVARGRDVVTDDDGRPDPRVVTGAVLVALAVLGVVVWRRRR